MHLISSSRNVIGACLHLVNRTHTHTHINHNCGDDRGKSDDGNVRKPHKLCISDFQLPEVGNLWAFGTHNKREMRIYIRIRPLCNNKTANHPMETFICKWMQKRPNMDDQTFNIAEIFNDWNKCTLCANETAINHIRWYAQLTFKNEYLLTYFWCNYGCQ